MKNILGERIDGRYSININGCWIWTGSINTNGYGHTSVKGKSMLAHRMAYQAFIGPIPSGILVRHKCDVRSCCNPAHLELGTYSDNTLDQYRRQRRVAVRVNGERNGQCKLTDQQVMMIKSDQRSGYELGPVLGVSRQQISRIRRGLYRGAVPPS